MGLMNFQLTRYKAVCQHVYGYDKGVWIGVLQATTVWLSQPEVSS